MDPDVNMWASVWRGDSVLLQLEGSVHRRSVLVVTSASVRVRSMRERIGLTDL